MSASERIDLSGGGLPVQCPPRFGDGFPGARVKGSVDEFEVTLP
jgi:hypothetical protein